MEDSDILRKFSLRLKKAKAYRGKWDKDMEKAYAFYGKRQWEDAEIQVLREQLRPALTFNLIRPVVNVVSGSEIANRFEPRFLPRSLDGAAMADMLTDIVKYTRDQCNGEQHDSVAFRDAVICGVGCVEFYHDYEDSIEGKTMEQRIPITEMFWDPAAREQNLLDAKWLIRERYIDEDEFMIMFPDVEERGTGGSSGDSIQPHDSTHPWRHSAEFYDPYENRVKVYEYQWYDMETRYLVEIAQPGEQGVEVLQKTILETDRDGSASDKLAAMREQVSAQGMILSAAPMPKRRYRRAFLLGTSRVLEVGEPPVNSFSYLFMTGYADHQQHETYWHGIVHDMRDPQEWANKFYSQMVHIVSTNPKGAMITPAGFFDNVTKAQKEWAKPNVILESNDSEVTGRVEIVQGQYPTGIDELYQHSLNIFGSVSGINPNYFVGGADNLSRTANTAIQSVQRQTMAVLAVIFDGLRLFRREQGKILVKFIREYMPEGAAVRITDENGMQAWQPFSQEMISGIDYEVIVEESPTSPSVRHEFWNSLIQTRAIDILMSSGILTGDIIADLMDVPAAIRERMKQNWMAMQQAMAAQPQAAPAQ